jgi:hypothetical protein
MTITASSLSQVAVASTTVTVATGAFTGGVAPVTYQWYRSTASGFTPGSGNSVSGGTSTTLNDSGLIPNTKYFYEVVGADSTGSLASSSQIAIATTSAVLSQNAFSQSAYVGTIDMAVGTTNVLAAQIDISAGASVFYPGQFVKAVASTTGGPPRVIGCTAKGDAVIGCIKFNIKDITYGAGQMCEIARGGTVVWLYSTGAITQFTQVCLDVTTVGGVQATGNTATIVGQALDGASAAGVLIRVELTANIAFTTA